ncbi:MAG: hypothetical protein ACE15D_07160 [Candidatus Eisenbacteria bacterium]
MPILRAVALALLAAIAGALAAVAAGAAPGSSDPRPEKMLRQIGVMEKIIDKVLLESPNFLVSRGDNARGLYLDSFGAVFTFDASMTTPRFALENYFQNLGERFEVSTDDSGGTVIRIKTRELEKDAKELEAKAKDLEMQAKKAEAKARAMAEDAEGAKGVVYENAKAELVQVLLDYGDTMTALRAGQTLLVAAFFQGAGPFEEKRPTHLVVSAKIDDLRAYSDREITEEEARSRIKIDEY